MNKILLDALINSMQDMNTTQPYFKGMLYGESGVGKTVMALQLAQAITPVGKTIIYIDSVEGWVSLLNHPPLKNRVVRLRYKGLSQIAALVQAFDEQQPPFDVAGCIILDEASTIARSDLDVALKARAKTQPDKKDTDAPTWPDMNINTHRMRIGMMDLLQKNIHVICVSHIREDTDQHTGRMYTRPDFMPKLSKSVREMMHLVGYVTSEESAGGEGEITYNRKIQVYPTQRIIAKTRIGGMGLYVSVEQLIKATESFLQGEDEIEEVEPLEDLLPPIVPIVEAEKEIDPETVGIVVN